jgi:hypothetical protein
LRGEMEHKFVVNNPMAQSQKLPDRPQKRHRNLPPCVERNVNDVPVSEAADRDPQYLQCAADRVVFVR